MPSPPASPADEFFKLRGDGIQFAGAAHRRVAGLVAELELFAQCIKRGLRRAAQNRMFFNHVFGDGRSGTIQPLAELLLQQSKQRGEKFIRLVRGGVFFQIIQTTGDKLRHGALPAQARIVRQIVRAFAPDERGEKRQHRQGLRGEKRRLSDERRRRRA